MRSSWLTEKPKFYLSAPLFAPSLLPQIRPYHPLAEVQGWRFIYGSSAIAFIGPFLAPFIVFDPPPLERAFQYLRLLHLLPQRPPKHCRWQPLRLLDKNLESTPFSKFSSSIVALSVSISANTSPSETLSPICLCHLRLSLRTSCHNLGISIIVAMIKNCRSIAR